MAHHQLGLELGKRSYYLRGKPMAEASGAKIPRHTDEPLAAGSYVDQKIKTSQTFQPKSETTYQDYSDGMPDNGKKEIGPVHPVPGSSTAEATLPFPADITKYIQREGRNSDKVKQSLHSLCRYVENNFFRDGDRVWVGYEPDKKDVPVFVAEVKANYRKAPKDVYGCKLVQRLQGNVSTEAKRVAKEERKHKFSTDELLHLEAFMNKITDNLLKKHTNLLSVSASKIKSKLEGKEMKPETCIVLYVHVKGIVPFYEDPFELEKEDFPYDVREGSVQSLANSQEYVQHLMMGCRIESAYGSGTLAGFIQLSNGNFGCLTCWHVFDTGVGEHSKELLRKPGFDKNVYQPGHSQDFAYKIGSVIDVDEMFDVALIEITERWRNPQHGNFPNAVCAEKGFPPTEPMEFNTGNIFTTSEELFSKNACSVVKYGAATGITFGNLLAPCNYVRLGLKNLRENVLREQLTVCTELGKKFQEKGDSGSLVFMVLENGTDREVRAFGMLVCSLANDYIIVTPIWKVLQRFGLPLRMFSFVKPWINMLEVNMKEINDKLVKIDKKTDKIDKKTDKIDSIERKITELTELINTLRNARNNS